MYFHPLPDAGKLLELVFSGPESQEALVALRSSQEANVPVLDEKRENAWLELWRKVVQSTQSI